MFGVDYEIRNTAFNSLNSTSQVHFGRLHEIIKILKISNLVVGQYLRTPGVVGMSSDRAEWKNMFLHLPMFVVDLEQSVSKWFKR